MPSIRVLSRDHPVRTLVIATNEDALIFRHSLGNPVGHSLSNKFDTQRCLVEFASLSSIDLTGYRTLGSGYGTLGLVTIDQDVFVCVVTRSCKAATVRPGETVLRIEDVDFCKTPAISRPLAPISDIKKTASIAQNTRLVSTTIWELQSQLKIRTQISALRLSQA